MKTLIHTLFFFLLIQQICFTQGTWTKIGDMPEIRLCHSADEINGKIYIVGGGNTEQSTLPTTMLICDSLNGSWTQDTLPNNIYRSFHTSCVVDSNLYIIGGIIPIAGIMNSTDEMWMYNSSTGEWISKPSMPTHRLNHDCAIVDGKIYVMGGMQVNNGIPNTTELLVLEVYDIASGTWSTGPNMIDGRWGHKAIAYNGKIYVIGGNLPVYYSTVEVYDPQANSWTLLNTLMPTGRYQFAACLLDNKIYTIDGWYHSGNGPIYDKVEVYDPIDNVWTTETPMPVAVGVSDGFTMNGKIYVFGGSYTTHPLIGISDIYEFTPPHFPLPPGTYTIGTEGFFTTIQAAFNKLSTDGVAGNVTLELIDTHYTAPTDSFGFKLNGPIPGAGPTSRVTIKPAENKSVVIEGAGRCVLYFLNTSFLTFDGVDISGSTTLTIHGLHGQQYTWKSGAEFRNNSDYNIVQNVIFIQEDINYDTDGAGFWTEWDSETADNNIIQNNFIKRAGIGIVIAGKNQYTKATGNIIRGNKIGSETDSLITMGIGAWALQNSIIEDNIVQNLRQHFQVFGQMILTPAIELAFSNNSIIRNNVVHNCNSNSLQGSAGIWVAGDAANGYGNDNMVYNNMVYDIQSTSTQYDSRVSGIQLWYQNNPKVFYNSVYLSGSGANKYGSAALYITSNVTNADIKNNIFVNTRDESPYCASAVYDYSVSNLTSDYNDLYYNDTNSNNCLVRIGTTNYLTLADWQVMEKDSNSVTEMPNFVAPYLHIAENEETLLESRGIPITDINIDFDGQTRHATTPDIGADEFNGIPVGVENEKTLPTEFALEQNYPNPFNPTTTFRYSIPTQSKVVIQVFDILGNEIATLIDEEKTVGTYEITWSAANLPSGVYFYRLQAGSFVETKKMVLMK